MSTRNFALAAALGIGIAAALLNAQAQKNGEEIFASRCAGCHALDRDKEGPRLGGVYGRAAGAVEGFEYSKALKDSKLVWNNETLDQWLAGPDKLVPNNDMGFHVDNSQERQALILFLKQNSGK
jgi:cytochrome c